MPEIVEEVNNIDLNKFYGLITLDEAYELWIDDRYHGSQYFARFIDLLVKEGWRII